MCTNAEKAFAGCPKQRTNVRVYNGKVRARRNPPRDRASASCRMHARGRCGAQRAAEAGRVLLFPQLAFALTADEQRFLTPAAADGTSKNISFDPATGRL